MIDVLTKNASRRKRTVYNKIIDEIESAIVQGILAPGSPLPSEKTLAEEYGVSRSSVRSALDALESKHLIFKKPGKGTFVKDNECNEDEKHSHTNTLALDINTFDINSIFYSGIIFNTIKKIVGKRSCRLDCVNQNQFPLLAEGQADSLISISARIGKYDIYNLLYKKGVYPLLFNRIVDLEGISYVAVDYCDAGKKAMAKLLDKGHRRIGWVDATADDNIFGLRYRGMMEAVNKSDSDIKLLSCTVPELMSDEFYENAIIKFLEENKVSAMYLMNGCFAAPLFNAARRLGIRIPDDLEVICFDRIEKLYYFYGVPFMYVNMPLEEMAEEAANHLIDRMEYGETVPCLKKIYKSEIISIGY